MKRLAMALFVTALFCACTTARAPTVPSVTLRSEGGAPLPLDAALREHRATVVTFFSAHCPCQRAHDARLVALIDKYTPLGAGFLVVASERGTSAAEVANESRLRGYPIVLDDEGKLARSLDAEYATYSVVLDPDGHVIYRGGFDSDKSHLRANPSTYLADALDDALGGRPVRRPVAKALGCTLELQ